MVKCSSWNCNDEALEGYTLCPSCFLDYIEELKKEKEGVKKYGN